ncbi:MAG: hypothetical protein ABFR53_09225, partial [Actinomycetota bacterium]
MSSPTTVAFIVGKGRSGSTILGDVLGSVNGAFHVGELWRLWSDGLDESHTCSCGETVRGCALWGPILAEFSSTPLGAEVLAHPQSLIDLQQSLFSFRGAAKGRITRGGYRSRADRYRDAMSILYESIAKISNADLLIDTSKWPLDPSLLDAPAGIRTYGIHLVRDPCDVAASWKRTKYFPDTNEPMPTFSSAHTAASWIARNIAAEWTGRRIGPRMMTLRYEDFRSEVEIFADTGEKVGEFEAPADAEVVPLKNSAAA